MKVLGQQLEVPVFDMGTDANPVEIVRQGLALAKRKRKNDYVLIDTAGRLHIDEALMDELKQIKELANPNEILLVVDAMTGQDAVNVADSFNEQLGNYWGCYYQNGRRYSWGCAVNSGSNGRSD